MTLKYDQHGRPYEDLTNEHKELTRRVKELENSLSIALEINDKFQRESVKLTRRAQEAEKELSQEKADRQHDSVVHAKELEKTLKK